jgi:hypothetical protein
MGVSMVILVFQWYDCSYGCSIIIYGMKLSPSATFWSALHILICKELKQPSVFCVAFFYSAWEWNSPLLSIHCALFEAARIFYIPCVCFSAVCCVSVLRFSDVWCFSVLCDVFQWRVMFFCVVCCVPMMCAVFVQCAVFSAACCMSVLRAVYHCFVLCFSAPWVMLFSAICVVFQRRMLCFSALCGVFQCCVGAGLLAAGVLSSRALRSATSGKSLPHSDSSPSTAAPFRSSGAPACSAVSHLSVKHAASCSVGFRSPMPSTRLGIGGGWPWIQIHQANLDYSNGRRDLSKTRTHINEAE